MSLFAVELVKNYLVLKMTKPQCLLSMISNHIQMLQATKMTFEKINVRLTSFQNHKLKINIAICLSACQVCLSLPTFGIYCLVY